MSSSGVSSIICPWEHYYHRSRISVFCGCSRRVSGFPRAHAHTHAHMHTVTHRQACEHVWFCSWSCFIRHSPSNAHSMRLAAEMKRHNTMFWVHLIRMQTILTVFFLLRSGLWSTLCTHSFMQISPCHIQMRARIIMHEYSAGALFRAGK